MRIQTFVFPMAAVLALAVATPADAFLDRFRSRESAIPDAQELQQQEQLAAAAYAGAQAEAQAGNRSRAIREFRNIVRNYPTTRTAAQAQFAMAEQLQLEGRIDRAFDEYQNVIENYRGSDQFAAALERQYELADAAKAGRKVSRLGVMRMRISNSDLVDMYTQIIENAPFSRFAPASQFSIGEVYQDQGRREEAVEAFTRVVERYPRSDQAEEAQFRIGAISYAAANRSEDAAAIQDARDAAQTYIARNPDGERSMEATVIVTQADAAQADKDLEVAEFYERQGNARAAAIYYNEVLRYEGTSAYETARERLSVIGREQPEALAQTPVEGAAGGMAVAADVDIKGREDFVGPELARLSTRPSMRGSAPDPEVPGDLAPIPYDEPDLPPFEDMEIGEDGVPLLLPPPPGALGTDPLPLPDGFEELGLPMLELEEAVETPDDAGETADQAPADQQGDEAAPAADPAGADDDAGEDDDADTETESDAEAATDAGDDA